MENGCNLLLLMLVDYLVNFGGQGGEIFSTLPNLSFFGDENGTKHGPNKDMPQGLSQHMMEAVPAVL